MKKTTYGQMALAVALALGLAGHASAQSQATNLNYNEIGLGYASIKVRNSDGSFSLHGYGVDGSYLFAENWYLMGSLSQVSTTYNSKSLNDSGQSAGLGARYGLTQNTDLVAEISYSSTRETITGKPNNNWHETTYGFGVRSLITPTVELSTNVSEHNPNQGSGYTSYGLGIGYHLSKEWVLRGSYSTLKSDGATQNSYVFSVGYKF